MLGDFPERLASFPLTTAIWGKETSLGSVLNSKQGSKSQITGSTESYLQIIYNCYLQMHRKLNNTISKNKNLYLKDLFKLCKLENFEASLIPYFWVPFHWNLWIISRHSLKYQDCQCTTSFKNKNFELALKKHLLQLLGHLLFETFDRCQAYNSSVCKKIKSKIL